MSKKTIVFDFDGVIHKYSKGWQDGTIYDVPSDNITKVLSQLKEKGYEIIIVSTRCATVEGMDAIRNWLFQYNLLQYVDAIYKEKPPALVYVDDRAIKYDPKNAFLVEQIENFETYQQQYSDNISDEDYKKLIDEAQKFSEEFTMWLSECAELDEVVPRVMYVTMLKEFIALTKKYVG